MVLIDADLRRPQQHKCFGLPNPTGLSDAMLRPLDDLVLVDTPPVLTVTDAAALAPSMDGVVLVAKPGVTRQAAFKQTLQAGSSAGVGARVLGVVLNEVQPNSRKYGYYSHRYYSKYSYYYSADGVKKKKAHKEPAKAEELKQD